MVINNVFKLKHIKNLIIISLTNASKPICTIKFSQIKEGKIKKGGVGLYRSFVHYDTRGWNARWKGKGVKDYRGENK